MSVDTDELASVSDWRCRQLRQSGFPRRWAIEVANDPRYDLHALIELVERGCPPELALRIVAPLDEARP